MCTERVKGSVPVTEAQKTKLARFKKRFREFASKKTRAAVNRKLAQTEGFIGALLTPVLSFLGTLLAPKL